MSYIIGKACVDCMDTACVNVCPVDCIPINPQFIESKEALLLKYHQLQKDKVN